MRRHEEDMAVIAQSKRHRGAVLVCREETDWLADSLSLSDKLAALLAKIDEVVKDCYDAYADFRKWASTLERTWSKKPDSYCYETQVAVEKIGATWLEVLRKAVFVIEWAEARGETPKRADEIRRAYTELISIERMDNQPLPAHLEEVSARACEQAKSGGHFKRVESGGF